MKRGDIVTVALHGDYGKPRPAVIVQFDLFDALGSVTILPITSDLRDAPFLRIDLTPSKETGLRKPSQIMVDKVQTVSRSKIGDVVGRLDSDVMLMVNRAVALFLAIS